MDELYALQEEFLKYNLSYTKSETAIMREYASALDLYNTSVYESEYDKGTRLDATIESMQIKLFDKIKEWFKKARDFAVKYFRKLADWIKKKLDKLIPDEKKEEKKTIKVEQKLSLLNTKVIKFKSCDYSMYNIDWDTALTIREDNLKSARTVIDDYYTNTSGVEDDAKLTTLTTLAKQELGKYAIDYPKDVAKVLKDVLDNRVDRILEEDFVKKELEWKKEFESNGRKNLNIYVNRAKDILIKLNDDRINKMIDEYGKLDSKLKTAGTEIDCLSLITVYKSIYERTTKSINILMNERQDWEIKHYEQVKKMIDLINKEIPDDKVNITKESVFNII